jgi:hypothetical protein
MLHCPETVYNFQNGRPLQIPGETSPNFDTCLLLADIVAKVENRTTLKISRKLTFGLLCCCVAFQRHYRGP